MFSIRQARPDDAGHIFNYIREVATHEGRLHHVTGTEQDVLETLFGKDVKTEVLMAEEDGQVIGYAMFFHSYSSFLCRYGLYLEDVYIQEDQRGKGYGRALIREVCRLAEERGCARVSWWCHDDNHPAKSFYESLGAEPKTTYTVYHLNKEALTKVAAD